MRVLGIDPGATTGWCLYDGEERRVIDCGEFDSYHLPEDVFFANDVDEVVVERLVPHGASFPQVVEAAYTCGRLVEFAAAYRGESPHELRRPDVRKALQELGTHGAIRVKDDASVWAALCEMHGGPDAGKKPSKKHPGGPLGGVKSHGRAALAVAVAWLLREDVRRSAAAAGV